MTNGNEFSIHTLIVAEWQAGMRLDRFLADSIPALSRSRIQVLIDEGNLETSDGHDCSPSRKVKAGTSYRLNIPASVAPEPLPQNIALNIIYEDDQLIVIDKPAGMVVHPAAGNHDNTLVNALLYHCGDSLSGIGGVKRPGIVHRIDKDTSGILVVAKTDAAHHGLARQFVRHSITRVYQAICWGVPMPRHGEITGNIGRNSHDRIKMALVYQGGKKALTSYRVLRSFSDLASVIECRLATGRTHQIRIHLSSIGHSVIGDPLYGKRHQNHQFPRQALHACQLGFIHPTRGEELFFRSDLPRDMSELLASLEQENPA